MFLLCTLCVQVKRLWSPGWGGESNHRSPCATQYFCCSSCGIHELWTTNSSTQSWNCLVIKSISKWRISLQRILCSVFSWSTQCTKVCISQVPLDFSPCVDNQNTNLKDKTSSSITGRRSLFLTGDATGLPWRPRLKLEIISCSGSKVPPP